MASLYASGSHKCAEAKCCFRQRAVERHLDGRPINPPNVFGARVPHRFTLTTNLLMFFVSDVLSVTLTALRRWPRHTLSNEGLVEM
jgi:hypothetical protein